jgi:hypothetical protein
MTRLNAPLTIEGRRRRRHGDLCWEDRSSSPSHRPTATTPEVFERIETLRRTHKWPAARTAFVLAQTGTPISRITVSRHLAEIGLNRRRFIDPSGGADWETATAFDGAAQARYVFLQRLR